MSSEEEARKKRQAYRLKHKERDNKKQLEWYYANREKARNNELLRKYGITSEQYEELLEKQNGCCAVCQKHHTEFKKRLAVDHDHKTREIFGLLCTFCNHKFIGRKRDPEHYERAARYLRVGTGWYAPERKRKRRSPRRKRTP